MPHIRIDGKDIFFTLGETIVEAAAKGNIIIPTLCHLPQTGHCDVCRICSVEVAGYDRFLPACSTHAVEGMDIQTQTPAVRTLRKNILSMIIAEGRHDCFIRQMPQEKWPTYQHAAMSMPHRDVHCPADGQCDLQRLAIEYAVPVFTLQPETCHSDKEFPLDTAYPMIGRDFSRCIQCGRCASVCDAIQVNTAIAPQFGRRIATKDWWPHVDYNTCTHCGECLQHCPTGALFAKKAHGLATKDDTIHKVRTTCPYCGVGCQQELHVKNERIIEVRGVADAEPNHGSLCVKGRFGYDFIYSKERLTDPLIRQADGSFTKATWDEALTLVAQKFSDAVKNYGPDSVGGVACARSINEDSYQMQKLFRAVFQTNNIDNCART